MRNILAFIFLNMSIILGQQELIKYEMLVQDFDSLIVLIEKTHPEPYMPFGGKMAFHKQAEELRKSIHENGMNIKDFYFLLSGFISRLNDGHTFISFPEKAPAQEEKLLPVIFTIAADGLFVTESQPQYANLTGYLLKEVNGFSMDSLLEKVQLLEPCENIYGAYLTLRKTLSSDVFTRRLFPEFNAHLDCKLISPSGKAITISFEYIIKNELKRWSSGPSGGIIVPDNSSLFSYQFIDEDQKIAYFPFNATYSREVFEIMKTQRMNFQPTLNIIYEKYFHGISKPADDEEAAAQVPSLTETFRKMLSEMKENNSTHLIIDLRMNGGGWTPITIPTLYMLFGDEYFSCNPRIEYNTLISDLWLSKYNITIEEYNKRNSSSYKAGDYRFGYFMAHDTAKPVSQIRKEYINSLLNTNRNGAEILKVLDGEAVYTPKIIVLTSPVTFSAAFHYAFMLKKLGDAVIAGVPSRQAGNTGMETANFTLTNSGLSGSISASYQLFFPNDFEKGKTLQPDYLLKWSDYMEYNFSSDAEIFYIMDLIKNSAL